MELENVEMVLESMKNAVIHNYIAPGLDSFLLNKNDCKVRMFQMTRPQEMYITPHNHRFDFACCVIKGWVTHYVYEQIGGHNNIYHQIPQEAGKMEYRAHQINEYTPHNKVPGQGSNKNFTILNKGYGLFVRNRATYHIGDWYTLHKDQFHAIEFTLGSKVLFLEGANQRDTSYFLEPVVNGKVISLFTVPEWMYQP